MKLCRPLFILTLVFLSGSCFVNASEIGDARKLVSQTYSAAGKAFEDDPAIKPLTTELQQINAQIRAAQAEAGFSTEPDAAARGVIMRKLKADPAYIKLVDDRSKLEAQRGKLLAERDPAYKAAVAALDKLQSKPKSQGKSSSKGKPARLPKTQTRLQDADPGRFVYEPHSPVFDKSTTLWFSHAATDWLRALPIGNGGFGAMVFGGLTKDVLQFNHDTLWTPPNISDEFLTGPYPDKRETVNEIRNLIFQGKASEAHEVVRSDLLKKYDVGSYQPFGELLFDYDFGFKLGKADVKKYHRKLDMDTGVASTYFEIRGTVYERQIFVSDDKDVIGIRMVATGGGTFSANMKFFRPAHYDFQKVKTASLGSNQISMMGTAYESKDRSPDGSDKSPYATSFESVAKVTSKGGKVSSTDGVLKVENVTEMAVMLSGVTNFNIDDPFHPLDSDMRSECLALIEAFEKDGFDASKQAAVEAHSEIFNRVAINLGEPKQNDIPVDIRVQNSWELPVGESDPYLTNQLFQMGRYLLICSSRPGSLWVNLRGIWNSELRPSWNSDYHHDINIEMSYWSAENTNMSECHIPLFDSLKHLRPRGQRVASEMFGNRGVFVALNHGGYLTAYPPTPPQSMWAMAGAWDATHVMEHYRFGGDKDYLKSDGYDIIKDHVLFCLDWLVTDPRTGLLVAGPDYSPETAFAITEEDRKKKRWGHEDMGCAMSQQIIWQIFTDFLEASEVLGVSDEITQEVQLAKSKLAPTRIGADGSIMEWSEDYISSEPDHRHSSHLWAFHPGYQFHVDNAPDMVAAAKKVLEVRTDSLRGGMRVSWSNICYVNFYARFAMAENAYFWVNNLNRIRAFNRNLMGAQGQVQDANFGYPGAVTEMLLQSHTGEIKLLPCLPEGWSEGSVSGIVARGGFEISMKWKDGKLIDTSILSKLGNPCQVRYGDQMVSLELKVGERFNLNKALNL